MGEKGRGKIRVLLVLFFWKKRGKKSLRSGARPPGRLPPPPNPPFAPAYRPVIGSMIKGEKLIKVGLLGYPIRVILLVIFFWGKKVGKK